MTRGPFATDALLLAVAPIAVATGALGSVSAVGAAAAGRAHVSTPSEVPSRTTPTPASAASPRPVPLAPEASSAAESSAACPADMQLVEGRYCPSLELVCEHPIADRIGCARYQRGVRCFGEPVDKRFCIDRYEWPNRVGAEPRVYVDWNEAQAACASVGKRLCARSEWTLACEGPKRLPYPYGFDRHPSPCNLDRETVPFDAAALENPTTRPAELARLDQADPIGSHPDCVSAYGVFDMVGNVDEWTDQRADKPDTDRPSSLQGGYWGPVRNTCRLATTSHGPSFRFYQVGFRCCQDAASARDGQP